MLLYPLVQSLAPPLEDLDGRNRLVLLPDDLADEALSLPTNGKDPESVQHLHHLFILILDCRLPFAQLSIDRRCDLLHPLCEDLVPDSFPLVIKAHLLQVLLALALVVPGHPCLEIGGDIAIPVHSPGDLLLLLLQPPSSILMVPAHEHPCLQLLLLFLHQLPLNALTPCVFLREYFHHVEHLD